ncbi:MAG: B12-binding domain-containing radical SAM protein [Terriglobales bacterium]
MIILFNPRATRPRSRRFPLSVLTIAAVLEGRWPYTIVDGNLDPDPVASISAILKQHPQAVLAATVMPGPQMRAAISCCRPLRAAFPGVTIVWGGYFPTLYPDAALNAPYVDYVVRGQGEDTFLELLAALPDRAGRAEIRGLSYRDAAGAHHHNPERVMKNPGTFPWLPYHRLPVDRYLLPSFLGRRTAVHQASLGCPYPCSFCGVATAFGSREKMEAPVRTAAVLQHLSSHYGADAVQFYDNNFFLREDTARELAERLTPLHLRWWCEARIDAMLRFSDATFAALRRSGATMIFFGAESGSNWVLQDMNKHLRVEQTLELAARIRGFGIIPEFSFVVGNPKDPDRDTRECLAFIRRLKRIHPASEIILYHYTPVPQRDRMYGDVEAQIQFPNTPEEWATERWFNFTIRRSPHSPWLAARTRRTIDNFRLVVASHWPTIQDIRMPRWGRWLLRGLSAWRYLCRIYAWPVELRWLQRLLRQRQPESESL